MTQTLNVEYRKVETLIPFARNPRTHSDAQVAKLAASIVEFGWTNPVLVDGSPVSLTAFEQRLLVYLMHRVGRVVGRTEIIEHIYAQDFDRDSNTVEVFVGRLRKKLGADLIETVRGQGYRLRRDDSAAGDHNGDH